MTRSHDRRSEDQRHGVSFQKDRSCQCRQEPRRVPQGHRRLRFSFQINDFKDLRNRKPAPPFSARLRRRRRCSRLSVSCQAIFRRSFSFSRPRLAAREALFSASIFLVKSFFSEKNFSARGHPGGRRRRLPKEATSPCQPGLSTFFAITETEVSEAAKNRPRKPEGLPSVRLDDSIEARRLVGGVSKSKGPKPSFFPVEPGKLMSPRPRRPARLRARRRYTEGLRRPQAAFSWPDGFSRRLRVRDPAQPAAI